MFSFHLYNVIEFFVFIAPIREGTFLFSTTFAKSNSIQFFPYQAPKMNHFHSLLVFEAKFSDDLIRL